MEVIFRRWQLPLDFSHCRWTIGKRNWII